ncbi:MAG: hypothetical protein M1825_000289 [Sarcosagium campestre]|nr:MAG: hypothetical protein M1825_000289 [Sarcosagium campestre]
MRTTDPRIRQTWDHISQNLEAANETAQASIFTFSHDYLSPCLTSVSACIGSCTEPCFPTREDGRHRRHRGRAGLSRAEYSFDFYDDWDEADEGGSAGLLGWGNDELDRLLAGSSSSASASATHQQQSRGSEAPRRQRVMSYGSRGRDDRTLPRGRRKTALQPHDGGPDPTVIPQSSAFGFLSHLTWFGGRVLRYKPSVADLQERPPRDQQQKQKQKRTASTSAADIAEAEPLLEDEEEEGEGEDGERQLRSSSHRDRQRQRTKKSNPSSRTVSSNTTNSNTNTGSESASIRSRADIFPSDSEADDDAIPLDDSFAMVLERRTTGSSAEKPSSRSTGDGDTHEPDNDNNDVDDDEDDDYDLPSPLNNPKRTNSLPPSQPTLQSTTEDAPPSLTELEAEEDRLRAIEEHEVERNRDLARRLAEERGLATPPPAPPTKPQSSIEPAPSADIFTAASSNSVPAEDHEDANDNIVRVADETSPIVAEEHLAQVTTGTEAATPAQISPPVSPGSAPATQSSAVAGSR